MEGWGRGVLGIGEEGFIAGDNTQPCAGLRREQQSTVQSCPSSLTFDNQFTNVLQGTRKRRCV